MVSRTSSLDHYLSNGKTFLHGSKFISENIPSQRKKRDKIA